MPNDFTVARIAISPASRLAVEPVEADMAAQQCPLQGSGVQMTAAPQFATIHLGPFP
jgi:hypothetical protein